MSRPRPVSDEPAVVSAGRLDTLASSQLTLGSDGARLDDDELAAGTALGRYVVVSRLGAGGMGVVYLAYDPELDRRVALKILRTREGDGDSRGRQLREAQALARLSHPNVVTVHDVGTYADRVWLAMEFVEGLTLTKWGAARQRSWREVLAVLVTAGRGLAAAHAVNLVHRDFKPDNVMIAADGRVLVMDFGLARAFGDEEPTAGASTSQLRATIHATHAHGTPGYMAPEQHRAAVGDGRTDQFGFCVSLWEALYGERPFQGETIGALVLAITKGELRAPPPARVVPRWLRRALERGLAPDPAHRWPSMDALLDELHRGHTRTRRRWIAGAGAAAMLAVVGVLVASQVQHRRALVACASEAAEIGASWNDDVRTQVESAFVQASPHFGAGTFTRAVERLDEWSAAWRSLAEARCVDALDDPDTMLAVASASCLAERRAGFVALVETFADADAETVRRAVGAAAGLARPEPCIDDADLLRRPVPPADAADQVADVRRRLERARSQRLAARFAAARVTIDEVVADARRLDWAPLVAAALLESGRITDKAGDSATAETTLQSAYLTAIAADEPAIAAEAAANLVSVVGIKLARPDDGRLWALQAEALLERTGATEGLTAATLAVNRGSLERVASHYDAALAYFERGIELRGAVLGADHPDVILLRTNLANVHQMRGDYDEAARLLEDVVATWETEIGPDHPETAQVLNTLGNVYWARGELDEAAAYYGRSLAIKEATLSSDHPDIAMTLSNLGALAYSRAEYQRSIELTTRALAIDRRAHGSDHPNVERELLNLATAEVELGEYDEALAHASEAALISERLGGALRPEYANVLMLRSRLYLARRELVAARADVEVAARVFAETLGPDRVEVAAAGVQRGAIETAAGDPADGERRCRDALATYDRVLGAEQPESLPALACIVDAELRSGRVAAAGADAERARAIAMRGTANVAVVTLYPVLATALWDRNPEGARALATAARDRTGDPRLREQLDAWLREHVVTGAPPR